LQRAVVTLVQPPVVDDGNPDQVELFEGQPERQNGALQHRGVGQIEEV
jgi:hypothetical protein